MNTKCIFEDATKLKIIMFLFSEEIKFSPNKCCMASSARQFGN